MASAASHNRDAAQRRVPDMPQASGWLALSGLSAPLPEPRAVQAGHFVAELSMPLDEAAVLLDRRANDATGQRLFSLFHEPSVGLVLIQRRGKEFARHVLPGPLPVTGGTVRLDYGWDVAASRWTMSLTFANGGETMGTSGRNPVAPCLSDMVALSGGEGVRHPAVLWFGLAPSARLPDPGAWIGLATPIETARGLVPAGQLLPGERVLTVDSGFVPVLGIERIVTPSRGSRAPVLLRAAYFGTPGDVLVSPDQPVCFAGPEAEYLFGEEEVILPARHLVDGRIALWDDRRGLASGVILDLGQPELLRSGDCSLTSRIPPALPAPRRLLDGYEAVPLLSLLARTNQRNAI